MTLFQQLAVVLFVHAYKAALSRHHPHSLPDQHPFSPLPLPTHYNYTRTYCRHLYEEGADEEKQPAAAAVVDHTEGTSCAPDDEESGGGMLLSHHQQQHQQQRGAAAVEVEMMAAGSAPYSSQGFGSSSASAGAGVLSNGVQAAGRGVSRRVSASASSADPSPRAPAEAADQHHMGVGVQHLGGGSSLNDDLVHLMQQQTTSVQVGAPQHVCQLGSLFLRLWCCFCFCVVTSFTAALTVLSLSGV